MLLDRREEALTSWLSPVDNYAQSLHATDIIVLIEVADGFVDQRSHVFPLHPRPVGIGGEGGAVGLGVVAGIISDSSSKISATI